MSFRFYSLAIFCFVSNVLYSQKNSFSLAFGPQYARIITESLPEHTTNPYRWERWATLGYSQTIKRWFALDLGLTYQERIPLETLIFPFDALGPGSGGGVWVISKYPTNPQNKLFYSTAFDYPFVRFPNFKYVDIEVAPLFQLPIKKVTFGAGFGFFGGILLNRNATTVTKEELPNEAWSFQPPFNVKPDLRYNRYDWGYLPKITVLYRFNQRWSIGFCLKHYRSRLRMNDTFVEKSFNRISNKQNFLWRAYLGGIDLSYSFGKKKQKK